MQHEDILHLGIHVSLCANMIQSCIFTNAHDKEICFTFFIRDNELVFRHNIL